MLKQVQLVRLTVEPAGAFGLLVVAGQPFVTCERTYDRSDGAQYTKILEGRWLCKRSWFVRGGYVTFEVIVPGHDRLLFHRGNTELDSEGCILVGQKFGEVEGKPAVLNSMSAWKLFEALTADMDGFELKVMRAS